ncbi:uncharacterized protein F13E9.13, mitochondrial isoform X1 [Cephus cinctus]|uniref:Uncharacterized protein F13E9.13, mitochondrial isoform X1 n=1 Tax=Cephus cinctus TaxID=211228 RepID=A0AAJ7BPL9_CEPCN|nr:uncharacterized protein F13E9.13, mitochondrial isoform X1 [Cephus cinctus]
MYRFRSIFPNKQCSVIGMVHVGALPGTPRYGGSVKEIISNAVKDAESYIECGVDGIMVENMHDIPYVRSKDLLPETTAIMTRVCTEIRKVVLNCTACGVQVINLIVILHKFDIVKKFDISYHQVLAGANKEALAVAQAANFQFIRAEGYVFSHIADEGFTDSCAGTLLRYRKQIGAEDVLVFADVKKKHSAHAITADVSLVETSKAAEFFLADGVILTGSATGDPADAGQLEELKESTRGPILVGSGVSYDNLEKYTSANAIIVGTNFKVDGRWENAVDSKRVERFMKKLKTLEK